MIQENDSELQVVEIRHFFFFLKLLNSDETVFRLLILDIFWESWKINFCNFELYGMRGNESK